MAVDIAVESAKYAHIYLQFSYLQKKGEKQKMANKTKRFIALSEIEAKFPDKDAFAHSSLIGAQKIIDELETRFPKVDLAKELNLYPKSNSVKRKINPLNKMELAAIIAINSLGQKIKNWKKLPIKQVREKLIVIMEANEDLQEFLKDENLYERALLLEAKEVSTSPYDNWKSFSLQSLINLIFKLEKLPYKLQGSKYGSPE